ncbi:MAG: competence/damage-inducible protein A [Planctomycetota bacterium]
MQAILLSIGDELALGQTVDTNSAWLAEQLSRLGVSTLLHETIADDRGLIAAALRWAASKADVLLVSGGLGPTEDDLTRQALADAMGVGLEEDAEALAALEKFFAERGYRMAERNKVQALCPVGAAMIPNPSGTAPGLRVTLGASGGDSGGAEVFVTPGVPREMKAMYKAAVRPAIEAMLDEAGAGPRQAILTTKLNTFGLGESDAAERLGDLMARDRNPTVGTTVSEGLCSIRVRAEFSDPDEAQRQLDDTLAAVEAAVGPTAFGRDGDTLQAVTVDLLRHHNQTLSTAESCTGGMVGSLVTDVPGSSAAYLGGWVTYTNALKTSLLGVPPEVIEAHGAVSEEVVRAMAEGARQRSGADLAVSLSGVAGPGGGTPDKPVGTVWIALATAAGTDARCARLVGSRFSVRDRAAKCALQMVRLHLLGEGLDHIKWLAAEPATA